MTSDHNPTTRFSNRVADYVRYRPGYPQALLETLRHSIGLSDRWLVADIGSGTGISTALLLQSGATVIGVEPNAAMRTAAESRFATDSRFQSQNGTAESTGLPAASIDLITAGQAFHWFDRARTRAEFLRILNPLGQVALFWNSRRIDATPFQKACESFIRTHAIDYDAVNHMQISRDAIAAFFGGPCTTTVFPNFQELDLEGFQGRIRSASYMPAPDHPGFATMSLELTRLFREYSTNGTVRFEYDTELSYGPLTRLPGDP